jgi:hypothetical protein
MARLTSIHHTLAICLLSLLSLSTWADSIQGQIVGIDCAEHGHLCPLHQFETHISEEKDFILLTADKALYTLLGISRDTLVRHVNKKVIASGTLKPNSHSIMVQQLQVQLGHGLSRYESIWQAP